MNELLRDILITDLPNEFVGSLLALGRHAYREAKESVWNDPSLNEAAKRYLLPHKLRGLFETGIEKAAQDCGLTASTERVRSGAGEYTLVMAGRIQLTCSRTLGRMVPPRDCVFREQYSDINQHVSQGELWSIPSNPEDPVLYAILAHGPAAASWKDMDNENEELGFLTFGFPSQRTNGWVQEPIDVIEIYERQQQLLVRADEDVADAPKAEPKLKPTTKPIRKGDDE